MVARAEDRGLGIMLWEWCRHMEPDRVLVVDMGALARGFPLHLDRYPGATVAGFDGTRLEEAIVRDWLTGLDVVYCAETFYDDRFSGWCADAGVRVVLHVMPEFYRWGPGDLPGVTWWAPTTWRLDKLPAGTRLVPVPVPVDRWPTAVPLHDGRCRFLHVAGKRAMGDRNGTSLVMAALGRCTRSMDVTIVTQDPRLPVGRPRPGVNVKRVTGGVPDYWKLYDDHDVLLMPRRYGGLSLPVHEAAGAGLALVMTATGANAGTWPIYPVKVATSHTTATPAGSVISAGASTGDLAAAMDTLACSVEERHHYQELSRWWAVGSSWEMLRPRIVAELERACS